MAVEITKNEKGEIVAVDENGNEVGKIRSFEDDIEMLLRIAQKYADKETN